MLSDQEIDELLDDLAHGGQTIDCCEKAIACIKELKARRDELQKAMNDIAFGRL